MKYSFEIGIIIGIGGIVNLFISFMDQEFSLVWILISIFVVIIADIWLLKRTIKRPEEKTEIYWAKHGVWSTGLLALLYGLFTHGAFTLNFLVSIVLILLAIVIQFSLYSYKLRNSAHVK